MQATIKYNGDQVDKHSRDFIALFIDTIENIKKNKAS